MSRGILGTVVIWLSCCSLSLAQERHTVYVEIDWSKAQKLAKRPNETQRVAAHADMGTQLTEILKHVPRLGCWDLRPMPLDPKKRVAVYHTIRISLHLTSQANLATSELKAKVVLIAPGNLSEIPLHSDPMLLGGVGTIPSLLGKEWRDSYDEVISSFSLYFPFAGRGAADVFRQQKVPIARGLAVPLTGGAVLPIEFEALGQHATSKFEITFHTAANPPSVLRTVSQGCPQGFPWPGKPGSLFLGVSHQLLNGNPYLPGDDLKLKNLTTTTILLQHFEVSSPLDLID